MKFVIVLLGVIAAVLAAPPAPKSDAAEPVQIVDSKFEKTPEGYVYSYELSDGSYREERGRVLDPSVENSPVDVEGLYRYLNEDQKVVEVKYHANEHGFVPEGESIDSAITSNARSLVDAKASGKH